MNPHVRLSVCHNFKFHFPCFYRSTWKRGIFVKIGGLGCRGECGGVEGEEEEELRGRWKEGDEEELRGRGRRSRAAEQHSHSSQGSLRLQLRYVRALRAYTARTTGKYPHR